MLDRHLRPLIDRSLDHSAKWLAQRGISANTLTATGLASGLIAAFCIALGIFWLALFFAFASRLLDGLDGAVARVSSPSALGGYLDILADFTFYAALPVGFVLYNPALNGIGGTILLASFFINSASFLGYAILAEKFQHETRLNGEKSHFHATGLVEGTETITFFAICLFWPASFQWLAPVFAALTLWTVFCRTRLAWRIFGEPR